jgi:hypothetical protein
VRKRWEGEWNDAYQRRGGGPRVAGAGDEGLGHGPPIRAVGGVGAVVFGAGDGGGGGADVVAAVVAVIQGEARPDGFDGGSRGDSVVALGALVLLVALVHLDHLLAVPLIALAVGIRVIPVSAHGDEGGGGRLGNYHQRRGCVLTSDSLFSVEGWLLRARGW